MPSYPHPVSPLRVTAAFRYISSPTTGAVFPSSMCHLPSILRHWLLVVMAVALLSSTAAAQQAPADTLFDAGVAAMERADWKEAAKQLERSAELEPAPGTLLNLGKCYEELGRPASAWSAYRRAAALSAARGQRDREAFANDKVAKLAPSVRYLVLVVTAKHPQLRLARDGENLPGSVWGLPIPVDPGSIRIDASAPGHESWSKTVEISAASPAQTRVEVPALEPLGPEPAPAEPEPAGAPVARESAPAPRPLPEDRAPRKEEPASSGVTWGWVATGVGAALALTGAIVWLDGQSVIDDANCPDGVCVRGTGDPDRYESGRDRERIGVALGVVGLAAIGTGVTLLVSSSGTGSASVAFAGTW